MEIDKMEGIDFLKVVISEITGEVRVIADKNFIKMNKRKRTEYLEETREIIIQMIQFRLKAEEVAEDEEN